jgi:nucleotide-binding universal stress UspA family protein
MTSSTSIGPSGPVGPEGHRDPFVAEPVEVSHVVVPLDGSPFSERALPIADWAASRLKADVHLVEVVPSDWDSESAEGAIRYLDDVARRQHAAAWDVVDGDEVAEALADAVASSPRQLVCMATHGRDRSAGPLGSVAAALVDRSDRPVMLVGPRARAVASADARVVAAVDGTGGDEALVPVALGWAARLARRLEIVTVAESPPPGHEEHAAPGRVGGLAEPESYVAFLVARCEGSGVAVGSQVVYDPVGAQAGLVPQLDELGALVVLGSRPRQARTVLGSHATHIVHDAAVPALAVPVSAAT